MERQAVGEAFLDQWSDFAQLLHSWYIDDFDDTTTIANGLWPERYLVLRDGRVTWASVLSEGPSRDFTQELFDSATAAFK